MSGKISDDSDVGVLDGTERFPVEKAGANKTTGADAIGTRTVTSAKIAAALGFTPANAANLGTAGALAKDTDVALAANSDLRIATQKAAKAYVDALIAALGTASALASDTDGTLAANSDVRLATQKAVKTYVDTLVTGLLEFKGSTDASGNPNYPAALKGDAYAISVAGKIGGASGTSVDVGDMVVAKADNAGGTQASVGTSWFILEHNLVGAVIAGGALGTPSSGNAANLTGYLLSALSGLGANIATALAIAVGTDGAPVIKGGALGTPSGGNLGNCTAFDLANAAGALAMVINPQTGTSYAVDTTDKGKMITQSNAAASAYSIAQAGTTGFADGYSTTLLNIGVGTLTLTPTTSTVNGAATLAIPTGCWAMIVAKSGNYVALVGGYSANLLTVAFAADFEGAPIVVNAKSVPKTIPFNATIIGYSLTADQGTFTAKVWKKATGTAIPTVSDVINTSGLALATGTKLDSSTVSDFTSVAIAANDGLIITLTAVSGSPTQISVELILRKTP